jgi:pimeloyl-ACP methyl ester carboxylesterase
MEDIILNINLKDNWNIYIKLCPFIETITTEKLSIPIIFIHGLASTHKSFDGVSSILQDAGIITACIDLKGHGNSNKINENNNDIDTEIEEFTVTSLADDISNILDILRNHPYYEKYTFNPWQQPVLLCGHSLGGNIAIEIASKYPTLVKGIICIDGGYIHLKKSFSLYEDCESLHPPDFEGLRWSTIEKAIREQWCIDWPESGIMAMINNFKKVEVQLDLDDYTTKFPKLDSDTDSATKQHLDAQLGIDINKSSIPSPKLKVEHVEPKLSKRRHLLLLKNLWDYNPVERYSLIQCPVLILPTGDGGKGPFTNNKNDDVNDAIKILQKSKVIWFEKASHDLPSQFPTETANTILSEIKNEYFNIL